MKGTKKYISGQIMVIVLLILSVLSVIAISVTLNTSRDTEEQIQDKQYQQYYSVGERNIMDMIRHLGRQATSILPMETNISINGLNYYCVKDLLVKSQPITCTIASIDNTYYNLSGTQEVLTTVMQIEDFSTLEGETITIPKDQDLVFDLVAMSDWSVDKTMRFGWTSTSVTSWNISYDCYVGGVYSTYKFVWDNSAGVNYNAVSLSGNSTPLNAFSVAYDTTTGGSPLTITHNSGCVSALGIPQFLRIKPVTDATSVELNLLEFVDSRVPLVRKITTVTTTANTGSSENPSAVLETTYLLLDSPLSLFDYVLRTEGDVIKD